MELVEARTLGEAWLEVARRILDTGGGATWGGAPTRTDTTYIPCVSLLDFWLRDGSVELVVYAHGLDFGKKAYGNSGWKRRRPSRRRPAGRPAAFGSLGSSSRNDRAAALAA